MRFPLADGNSFEIPDDWIAAAAMARFLSPAIAYTPKPLAIWPTASISILAIALIKPVYRSPGFTLDFGGFDRSRLISILNGIADGVAMEPIQVFHRPSAQFQFEVYDGFHRFYASITAGFTGIPAIIRPEF